MTDSREKTTKDHIDFPMDWNEVGYRIVSSERRISNDRFRLDLKPYFLGFNQVEIGTAIRHPAHRHSSFELIAVKTGPYRCLLNGEKVELDSSHCLLIKPGDYHEVDLRAGQSHYVLQFDLEEKQLNSGRKIAVFDRNLNSADQAIAAPIDEVEPFLKRIANQSKNGRRFAAEIQDCLTEFLFWVLLSYVPEERLAFHFRKLSKDQRFMDKLDGVAAEYSGKNLTIGKLAELMDVSKSTLAKRCSELLGESPGHYLLRGKIAIAIKLLSTTNMRIKEISFDLGFQNPYHFSRVFKRIAGYSPTEFRKTILGYSDSEE